MSGEEREQSGHDELREELAALPRSVQPPRDLWPGIQREITGTRVVKADFLRRPAVIAAAAALLLVAALAGGLLRPGGEPVERAAAPEREAAPERAAAPEPSSAAQPLDLQYAAAAVDVLDRLERDNLDPETVAVIRHNLDIIDEAVRDIRRALDEEPSNARLNHLLTAEYQRRSAVLRQAAELTDTI